MATVVLAAAASGAASYMGAGVFLAGVAGMAGGYLGGFIDRSIFSRQTRMSQEGSRLTDLMVQASTYGKAIPLVYGTIRIAGNMIWSRPIQEHVNTTTQRMGGGKRGGTKIENTTYTYTCSFAVAICNGPITDIMRVWADAKQLTLSSQFTLYLGTEDQLPDTFMSAFHPSGHTPAYRGLAYVVFKDFPLGDFGNRIPNFTFEVRRTIKKPYGLEEKITDITLIPGAGEYVYDTVFQEKFKGKQSNVLGFIQTGKRRTLNQNTQNNKADVQVALDQLKTTLPNVEWVSVVVNWFSDSIDPEVCTIKPGVEFNGDGVRVYPDEWNVAGFTRSTAHEILTFPDRSPTYGGTPTDQSLLRLCQELKKRGYKVMLYPMLQVDTIKPQSKPWRGRIKPNSVKAATTFFTRTYGYNAFITHYAKLMSGKVDAFMLGSELVGLTTYMNPIGVFPAVAQIKALAAQVKTALGVSVQVMYGGDWSEYHSVGGWYHLDPLWADPNIDAVAIDCYFPLTPDLPQSQIDYQKIYDGWSKDEGWDYFWDPTRTVKTLYSGPTYAWKNVKHWWNSMHTNPDGTPTSWIPKMKPLWFSELGFPSVDGCANQPNVFVDPDSIESFYPRRSKTHVDFLAQYTALEASLDYLKGQNGLESHFAPRKFIWTWDARPFPTFPNFTSVWSDGRNWKTGHWIQGKLGLSNLGQIVADLMRKVGYDSTMYDTTELTDNVSGFIVTNRQSVRACLEQLATAYFFDMVESDGRLTFIQRGRQSITTLDFTELVPGEDAANILTIIRTQELELPRQVDVLYLNQIADYQTGTQSSQRQTVQAVDSMVISLPIVLNDTEAKKVADVTLYNAWVGRVQYHFILPPKYALLEPTDVITITQGSAKHLMRINATKLMRNGMQEIIALAEDISSYDFHCSPSLSAPSFQVPSSQYSTTHLELLDLPAFPMDDLSEAYVCMATTGLGDQWSGSAIYLSDDGGENYSLLQKCNNQAFMGSVLNSVPNGITTTWDRSTFIDVTLIHGELQSVTEIAVLNGANVFVIGDEILQFQSARLIDTYTYRLSNLLRGRLGTEWAVSKHTAGERFILLTNAVRRELIPSSGWGMLKKYKPVSIGSTLGGTTAQDFTYEARALKPYAPVHIVGSRNSEGDLTLRWKRRTRMNGDWRDGVDVPLAEESERYEVDILQGKTWKRTLNGLTTPTAMYTGVQQVMDFGSVQTVITVNVHQISALVGRGYSGQATV